MMLNDPEASKFLHGILPTDQQFSTVVVNQVKEKQTRTLKKKLKMPTEGYKWPYYDSYVPNLGMNDKDKKIVRRGIQRQYFPNDQGNFNMGELKKRRKGIKNIEHQYVERIKSASSPTRKGAAFRTTAVRVRDNFRQQVDIYSPREVSISIDAGVRNAATTSKNA